MTIFYFAGVDASGVVRKCRQIDDGDPTPPSPYPPAPPDDIGGLTWTLLSGPIDWAAQPTVTSSLLWNGGSLAWQETRTLAQQALDAEAAIEDAANAARESVILNPTKALEYQRAEAQARPYAAAGYPDPAPDCVDSWARAKRWTNGGVPWTGQRAADDIIATADRWYGALDGIRDLRLDAEQHLDAIVADPAGTGAQVAAVLEQFQQDLAQLMKGLTNGQ